MVSDGSTVSVTVVMPVAKQWYFNSKNHFSFSFYIVFRQSFWFLFSCTFSKYFNFSFYTVQLQSFLLPARRRPQGLVVIGVCLSVCLCALCLSARYLKNRFMDHHQIWWVGAGGEPLEQVQFWC